MSDNELVDELTAHAQQLEDADGSVNPFLAHEHEMLLQAAQRLNQLMASAPPRR